MSAEGLREALNAVVLEVYSGTDGKPAEDPAMLRGLADWLDRIDDKADAALALGGRDHRVEREMQADLRRVADNLDRLTEAASLALQARGLMSDRLPIDFISAMEPLRHALRKATR